MAKRQLHFRATEREYLFLRRLATTDEETLSNVLRTLIRRAMSRERELQPGSVASAKAQDV
jgi:hypothetical protein